jgi:hypothetical protein
MSYSLAVVNGDLQQQGSSLSIVYGINKLTQDITLWLMEQYGIDRFHPNMGSVLQQFIGGMVDGSTQAEVQGEVLRVLQNYQAVQYRGLRQNPQVYSLSELLYSIDSVTAAVTYDTVNVSCALRNAENQPTVVNAAQSV